MSNWNPIKRREFIRRLKKLNFIGPFIGSKHQFMIFENHRLTIPSNEEYPIPKLRMNDKRSPGNFGKRNHI